MGKMGIEGQAEQTVDMSSIAPLVSQEVERAWC